MLTKVFSAIAVIFILVGCGEVPNPVTVQVDMEPEIRVEKEIVEVEKIVEKKVTEIKEIEVPVEVEKIVEVEVEKIVEVCPRPKEPPYIKGHVLVVSAGWTGVIPVTLKPSECEEVVKGILVVGAEGVHFQSADWMYCPIAKKGIRRPAKLVEWGTKGTSCHGNDGDVWLFSGEEEFIAIQFE